MQRALLHENDFIAQLVKQINLVGINNSPKCAWSQKVAAFLLSPLDEKMLFFIVAHRKDNLPKWLVQWTTRMNVLDEAEQSKMDDIWQTHTWDDCSFKKAHRFILNTCKRHLFSFFNPQMELLGFLMDLSFSNAISMIIPTALCCHRDLNSRQRDAPHRGTSYRLSYRGHGNTCKHKGQSFRINTYSLSSCQKLLS